MVLRKIAQAGLSGLAGMINGTPPDTATPAPAPTAPAGKRSPAVASIEPQATSPDADMTALGYTDH
jgi:hypothetical protein